jgi:hypothetical protein
MRSRVLHHARPALAAALVATLALPSWSDAHEIPANVTVLAFFRPEAQRLRLIVRVPLEAMRDIEFPLRGPGYLDIAATGPLLHDAARLWIADYLEIHEDGRRLATGRVAATRVSLPTDRSFADYDLALAHIGAPELPADTELPWQQAMLDVLVEYPIASDDSRFSIRPALAHLGLRTVTVLRFLPHGGTERVFQFAGNPGLVPLDPRWHQAFFRFVRLGFRHILEGLDHLLFVLCLVIPFRRIRPLFMIVTAFTAAHSITLIASAFGLAPRTLWFQPLIETLIALSIVWMAFENIVGARLERRWLFAFGFGLVHGFGFSFVLRDSLQFAGSHLLSALLAFNIGVELGQLLVVALAVPALGWLFSRVVAERAGTILLSALVAHTAWHWMTERGGSLRQYRLRWPAPDLALLASVLRWLMLLLILAGAVWLLHGLFRRIARADRDTRDAHAGHGARSPVANA